MDFFCEHACLVIEADGAHHFPPPRAQLVRDAWLRAAGLSILRFSNDEILHQTERVLDQVRRVLRRQPAPLSLRERGRGEGTVVLPAAILQDAAPGRRRRPAG